MESERLANQLQAINTEIETRLKPDLDVVCGLRDRVFEEIMEILQLKQNIETIRDNQDKNVELQVMAKAVNSLPYMTRGSSSRSLSDTVEFQG
mmetsp:Transcript_4500/g.19258  ORF Transcript_4500/g.19258 Transcript_4500/m.19258 type:complete len:93 (+) Transcript_4500:193-471(+)